MPRRPTLWRTPRLPSPRRPRPIRGLRPGSPRLSRWPQCTPSLWTLRCCARLPGASRAWNVPAGTPGTERSLSLLSTRRFSRSGAAFSPAGHPRGAESVSPAMPPRERLRISKIGKEVAPGSSEKAARGWVGWENVHVVILSLEHDEKREILVRSRLTIRSSEIEGYGGPYLVCRFPELRPATGPKSGARLPRTRYTSFEEYDE